MNKLTAPGRLWIASDVHLGPESPATAAAFHAFLAQAAHKADALILAGDIFDAWIGDDVALASPEPWLQASIAALQQVSARIPLWIGHGNRDFLIGPRLARHLGARLLTGPTRIETATGPILLAHGDEYCLDDHKYQRFRRIVRNRRVQAAYLALPLRTRKAIAAWARGRSRDANQYKSQNIMDVTPQAIQAAMRQAGNEVHTLIHGHTHRPARHALAVDGRECERVVLPDWELDHADPPRGGWVEIDEDGVHLQLAAETRPPVSGGSTSQASK